MKHLGIGVIGVVIGLFVLVPQMLFVIDEREQAIITQFGAHAHDHDPGAAC
jgi:regulator of protease activity HflC (stomatin/prohibitin superfamily)